MADLTELIEDLTVLDQLCDPTIEVSGEGRLNEIVLSSPSDPASDNRDLENEIDYLICKAHNQPQRNVDQAITIGPSRLTFTLILESEYLKLLLQCGSIRAASFTLLGDGHICAGFNRDTRGIWQAMSFSPTLNFCFNVSQDEHETPFVEWDNCPITTTENRLDVKVEEAVHSVSVIFTPDSQCTIIINRNLRYQYSVCFKSVLTATGMTITVGKPLNHCTFIELDYVSVTWEQRHFNYG